MEYTPRYRQPFTLSEATGLDTAVIYEEISRLNNSLEHLKKTQIELRELLASSPDPDFEKAVEENDAVIGSQEERISILKMALTEKGITPSAHYDGGPRQGAREDSHLVLSAQRPPTSNNPAPITPDAIDDGGIDL